MSDSSKFFIVSLVTFILLVVISYTIRNIEIPPIAYIGEMILAFIATISFFAGILGSGEEWIEEQRKNRKGY